MNIDKSTKLLVISPHPDDETLGCGGLIGKCKKMGAKTLILYTSVGSNRQLVTGKTDVDVRTKEIDAVAKFTKAEIKIQFSGKEFCQLDTVPQKDIIEYIEDVIEEFKPTIVAIPSSTSYNQDHRAVWTAAITALRPVPKKMRHMPGLIIEYFEPYFWSVGSPKQPNTYLDLSEKYQKGNLLDFKINLYKCHATQVRDDPFPRSIENVERIAHLYGKEIGVSIAEAYHVLRYEL